MDVEYINWTLVLIVVLYRLHTPYLLSTYSCSIVLHDDDVIEQFIIHHSYKTVAPCRDSCDFKVLKMSVATPRAGAISIKVNNRYRVREICSFL